MGAEKEEEKVPVDDTPCLVCDKCTHPDMVGTAECAVCACVCVCCTPF